MYTRAANWKIQFRMMKYAVCTDHVPSLLKRATQISKLKIFEMSWILFWSHRANLQQQITIFLFRLDMCRRSHANDVCNRGTAGNFSCKRDFSNKMLLPFNVFITFFIYFPECEVFKLYFHLLSNNIKINFIPSNTPKQIFSLSIALCLHLYFIFHMYTFRDSILHSPKLFSTALTSVKKFAQKLLFYPSTCKKQSTIL